MPVTVALAGDTMLGRDVAERIAAAGPRSLFAPELREITSSADLFVLNLECCISERGAPWPDPAKPFFFRAPPVAAEALRWLGVDAVTMANNHALDYGTEALLDTVDHLAGVGIDTVGAGSCAAHARAPAVVRAGGLRVGLLGMTDHPADFAAEDTRPGVAYANLRTGLPGWVRDTVQRLSDEVDLPLVLPHWGPNMAPKPVGYVRAAARQLRAAGAAVVAGHSAHVCHGVGDGVCYDLGDFVDDYAVNPRLRNDLGLLFRLTVDDDGGYTVAAMPLALDFCHTRLAQGAEYDWVARWFTRSCAEFGTGVTAADGWLSVVPSRIMEP